MATARGSSSIAIRARAFTDLGGRVDCALYRVPSSAPDFSLEDTPTAVLIRQVLGAISQFEKASLVAKLKALEIASLG
jgi:hypothetical protein